MIFKISYKSALLLVAAVFTMTANANTNQGPALVSATTNNETQTLLADSFQKTLYVFDVDLGKKSPACSADCALIWPPYLVAASEAVSLKAPLGSVTREDGTIQLTFGGRPLYTYIYDRLAGDDKGDGLGNVWHYVEVVEGEI